MSFQPVIPLGGYAGWRFLTKTISSQRAQFDKSAQVTRLTSYFRDKIATVRKADDLVADRRLLQVALGAFGLADDINSKAFIRKILADGTLKSDALANRLSDKRYAAFSRAFGFGDLGARTALPGFADQILSRYGARQFEVAVGEQDDNMRLALGLNDQLRELTANSTSNRAQWFAVMGSPPTRRVFEGALGLPSSFGRLDIDQQLTTFTDRSERLFGTDRIADFKAPELQEKLIRTFLMRAQISAAATPSGASVALSLLQSGAN